MKNRNLFILMAAVLPLISCGTVNRSAFYGGPQFRNSVYYTSSEQVYAQSEQQSANDGQEYDAPTNTKTVHIGEANEVNINYEPGVTYSIVDDDESYAARLRKFDSPTYTINIDFVDPIYWCDLHFGWYRPYGFTWGTTWHSPWWNRYYSWYGPSFIRWYDPWYTGPYWAWYNPWMDPWWGPVHRPGIHYPPHKPGHGPGAAPGLGRPGRDVYYGKRNSAPTYRDLNRNGVTSGVHNNVSGKPNTGSVTRRPSNNVKSQGQSNVKSSNDNRNNSSYTRNNSSNSYNRSSSSYSNGNSSSRSSYGNSGGSRSQGGGSSYRRR